MRVAEPLSSHAARPCEAGVRSWHGRGCRSRLPSGTTRGPNTPDRRAVQLGLGTLQWPWIVSRAGPCGWRP